MGINQVLWLKNCFAELIIKCTTASCKANLGYQIFTAFPAKTLAVGILEKADRELGCKGTM